MRGALVVAVRELIERRSILIAALVAGLLPFAGPLLPGTRGHGPAEVRDAMAILLAVSFSFGLAVLLGATVVARDLAEGRMGFDFSRPLGTGAIWGGRFLGAGALIVLVLGLILSPTTLAGGGIFAFLPSSLLAPGSLALAGVLLVVVPLAHAVSVAFRSRSGWLGVDMVCAVIALLVAGTAARRLFDGFAIRDLTTSALVLWAMAIPVFWAASAVQVAVGRTDLRRGHKAQSIALWGMLLAVVASFDGYTRWVVAAVPKDLVSAEAEAAPRGDWVVAGGEARGRGDYYPSFLVHAVSGQFVRLGPATQWTPHVKFSADGRRVAWTRTGGKEKTLDVRILDLDHPENGPQDPHLSFSDPWLSYALSPDGARLAALEGAILTVYELPSGRNLASVRLGERNGSALVTFLTSVLFLDSGHVRVYWASRQDSAKMRICEVDVASKRVEETGGFDLSAFPVLASRGHDRLLLVRERKEIQVLDGRTGAILSSLGSDTTPKSRSAGFLDDGRVALAESDGERAWLRVFSREGREERNIPLGSHKRVGVGAEVVPGKLVVSTRELVLLVDVGSGEIREVARSLQPLVEIQRYRPSETPAAGSLATKLFQAGGGLVYLDPITGERRVIAGRVGS